MRELIVDEGFFLGYLVESEKECELINFVFGKYNYDYWEMVKMYFKVF